MTSSLHLRPVESRDIPQLYEYQLDPETNRMAGTKPRSAEAFREVWARALTDPRAEARAILVDDVVVGTIGTFEQHGRTVIGYSVIPSHWGRGIASGALAAFLAEVTERPLHASVVCANAASIRVLEKCGFRQTGCSMCEETDRYVAAEVAEFVLE